VTDHADFHIPHIDKIEWMIETTGWAIEPVAASTDTDPPVAGYAYTIGFPAAFGFPEVLLFGLTPVAARGLFGLVADLLAGGTEIPLGVPVIGLLDGEQRAVFAPVDTAEWAPLFGTAVAWYRGAPFDAVQLLWPDRNGMLPHEIGFDQRLRLAHFLIDTAAPES